MMGTLVIDERICRVVNVEMRAGAFWIEAIGHGPWYLDGDVDYQLHGNDGQLIVQSRCGPLHIYAGPGDVVSVDIQVRVDTPDKIGRPM